jgi:hypothetical protein
LDATGAQQFSEDDNIGTVAGKWLDWTWVDGTPANNLNCGNAGCVLWSTSGGSANSQPKYVVVKRLGECCWSMTPAVACAVRVCARSDGNTGGDANDWLEEEVEQFAILKAESSTLNIEDVSPPNSLLYDVVCEIDI